MAKRFYKTSIHFHDFKNGCYLSLFQNQLTVRSRSRHSRGHGFGSALAVSQAFSLAKLRILRLPFQN
jgi:hypothetical protein